MANDRGYLAIVDQIAKGPKGPYAISKSEVLGSVTFSLKSPVWQESDWPEPGIYVVLAQVRKSRDGWRAYRVRYMKPSDEQC